MGRAKLPESEKRKPVGIRLHPKVAERLSRVKFQSRLIEKLLCDYFGIE